METERKRAKLNTCCVNGTNQEESGLDIITILYDRGLTHILKKIFNNLDGDSLDSATFVNKTWTKAVVHCNAWRRLVQNLYHTSDLWWTILMKTAWNISLFQSSNVEDLSYHGLYFRVLKAFKIMDTAWTKKLCCKTSLEPRSGIILCFNFDTRWIVIGTTDSTIEVYNKMFRNLVKVLKGHTGPVLCLQLYDTMLFSGSADYEIRVWNTETWETVNVLKHHTGYVRRLFVRYGFLLSGSTDKTLAMCRVKSQTSIKVAKTLKVEFDSVTQIVFNEIYVCLGSESGAISFYVPMFSDLPIATYNKHHGEILCLHLCDNCMLISSSRDGTVWLWNLRHGTNHMAAMSVPSGHCVFIMEYISERVDDRGNKDFVEIYTSRPYFCDGKILARGLLTTMRAIISLCIDDTMVAYQMSYNKILIDDYLSYIFE